MNQMPLELEEGQCDLSSETKECSKCKQNLPLNHFTLHSGRPYLRPECKKCNNELSKVRDRLKRKHGMPSEGYSCPICLGTEEDVKGRGNNKNGSWVLDHCHESEEFRGWLCHKCNRSLGGFDDDEEMLRRAIKYLKDSRQ